MRSSIGMPAKHASRGQVLVLFVLFLLVLLGISALAVDYATWLLTDRSLQNHADHAALAGADVFDARTQQGSCGSGVGVAQCIEARAQAWASLNNEVLNEQLSQTVIACLAFSDSPAAGETDSSRASAGACTGEAAVDFGYKIWVTTPPPQADRYTDFGGRYGQNFGVVWVRVDKDVSSFLGGALGIDPEDRTGWATAGALPADFALQTFCRNDIAPESGVCVNSSGVTINGQGGIRLLRGDIGSNESLSVTSNVGSGVVLLNGNMFLVNRTCGGGTWNCPNNPPLGGISDGINGKNAFYIAPLPVPHFESPTDDVTDNTWNCQDLDEVCIPWRNQTATNTGTPGDWTCSTTSSSPVRCGTPTVTTVSGDSSVTCVGAGGGNPGNHYYPNNVQSGGSQIQGDGGESGNDSWQLVDETTGTDDAFIPTPAVPVDYLYSDNVPLNNSNVSSPRSFTVNLGPSGPRLAGGSTVRFVGFKTDDDATPNGALDNTGNAVTVRVTLVGTSGTILADPTVRTLTDVPTLFEFTVAAGVIPTNQYNSLRLQFLVDSSGLGDNTLERGAGIAFAEIEHPDPQPASPPYIPPGYYRSIILPNDGCAILDPTGEFSQLYDDQLPGIYQFGGTGSNNDKKIKLGDNAFLIGDGVTLVFDSDWPESGSNQGISIGGSGALVLNTMRVPGTPAAPCTPSETETLSVNMSSPLSELPYSAVCAAWVVDTSDTTGVRPGLTTWEACDTTNPDSASHCVERDQYNPFTGWRGVTFYFTPDPSWATAHASMNIRNRFEMSGNSGADAGIAFRGIMYAPYDDVDIQGGNGFRTVGQVLSWTVKFNGGSAYIDLDYPYDFTPAKPYLLEPTVSH
jgi:hypothetical protein